VTNKRRFEHVFEDTSPSTLRWDYEGVEHDRLAVEVRDGRVHLYVNRDAALVLARAFAEIALGEYPSGFHVHINEDFDG